MSANDFILLTYRKYFSFLQEFIKLFQTEKKEDNVTSIVYRIIRNYRIKVTITSIREYLKSHPFYPSLISICDFFDEMNIMSYALRIDKSELWKLSEPFIAHIKDSGGKVLLVYTICKENVIYTDSYRGKKGMSTRVFFEKWDGVVIMIKPTDLSGEFDYNEKKKNEIIKKTMLPSLILVFTLASLFGIITNKLFSNELYGMSFFVILLAHFIGLTFSVFLFRHELNLKTKFTDRLCHIATNTDCDVVTKSKASKIFGCITWADVGVTYFIGGIITLFMLPVTYSYNNLALFSFTTLPYPVFSILYQWLKIRKWCPLCLSVQFILITEFIILFKRLRIEELNINTMIPVLLIFSTLFLIVLLMKLLFILEREKDHEKHISLKIKRDPNIFLTSLRKGERIDIPFDKSAIIFGDYQTKVLVSVFLSFHCSACAKRFNTIQRLITNNFKIKIQLIFSPSKDEMSIRILKSFFSLIKSGKKNIAMELLQTWYDSNIKERLEILEQDNIAEITEEFNEMIRYNTLLFSIGRIKKVPSIYVNGYPLPNAYTMEDLRYHISELEKMKLELSEIEI